MDKSKPITQITGFTPYRDQIIHTLQKGYKGSLGDVANVIYHAHLNGRPIITIGNGGSMATALHFAADLRSLGIAVIDPPSVVDISRVANDYGYGIVFATRCAYNPLVIAFSCSGTSPNIVMACQGNDSILFTSTMKGLHNPDLEGYAANLVVRVYSDDYEVIEDIHLMMCHCLKKMLKARMGA